MLTAVKVLAFCCFRFHYISAVLCFVGVTYNVSLLRDVLNHPKFRLGDITTKFLPQEYPKGFKGNTCDQGCQ